ncbi:MAG: hypothetical protein Q9218_007945 [Villophora microphyllina]
MDSQYKSTFANMYQYYKEGRFTDLIITCQGQKFECHKIVICTQSKFFEAACSNGFKESSSSVVDLPEDNPKYIKFMLEFLYGYRGVYTDSDTALLDVKSPDYILKNYFGLIVLGDKYGIPALKEDVEDYLDYHLRPCSSVSDFLELIPFVYTEFKDHHSEIRDTIVQSILRHPDKILWEKNKAIMLDHMQSIPEFREAVCLGLLRQSKFAVMHSRDDSSDTGIYKEPKWCHPSLTMDGDGDEDDAGNRSIKR